MTKRITGSEPSRVSLRLRFNPKDVLEKEETYKVNYKGASKTLNSYLLIKIGDEVKEFKLLFISNKELEERDLYKWITELETLGLKKPTTGEIEEKGE